MPADSLKNMCLRACSKITKRITDIGGMPYHIARPFLLKIESPEQLRTLEEKSPQIIGHDGEIWLALIKRDIPNWQTKKHEPQDPKNWWKVYRKLKNESKMEMDVGADELRAALNDKNEKQLAEIKPMKAQPRGPTYQQRVSYGYQSGKTGSKGSSKMTLLEKIKKEARDARNARTIAEQQQQKKMTTTVTHAPTQFVEEVKTRQRMAQQSPERPVRVPRPPLAVRRPEASSSSPTRNAATSTPRFSVTIQQFQEREARLRALTSGRPLPSSTAVEGLPKERLPESEIPTLSVESPSTAIGESEPHSDSLLEDKGPSGARKSLGDALGRPGTQIGGRSASPQIASLVRKRKKGPDLFMVPTKRKAVAVGSNAPLR
jgi:elongin-A